MIALTCNAACGLLRLLQLLWPLQCNPTSGGAMKKLNARQTQRLLLAGTVGFPKPFPTIGSISIEKSKLVYSRNCAEGATFVVVQERHKDGITRLILRQG